jgi:hypothetical protein
MKLQNKNCEDFGCKGIASTCSTHEQNFSVLSASALSASSMYFETTNASWLVVIAARSSTASRSASRS